MADPEVETLRRELEALKLQLEHERKKTIIDQSSRGSDAKQQLKPELNACLYEENVSRGGDKEDVLSINEVKEPRNYVQHAAAGSRRGKWWLRDRQVLSRTSAAEVGAVTLKVREMWAWSGRTVILDKIVRLDEDLKKEELAVKAENAKMEEIVDKSEVF